MKYADRFCRWAGALLGLGLFGIIVGTKWDLIERFGSDIPNWDQWDAEGYYLLGPWFERNRFWENVFFPHNEHRVVLTKLQNLGLVLLSGQWDSRLEMVANAMLHALVAVVFWFVGRRWIAGRWQGLYFAVLAALFALPLGWQNTIGGFHSQQYWLLLLSMAGMLTLPFARPWSPSWWGGVAATALALLSMASGLLAAAVVIGVVGWQLVCGVVTLRDRWPTLVVSAIIVAVGLATRVAPDHHEPLYAKTLRDFVHTMVNALQWPVWRKFTWPAALVLWAPWTVVVVRVLSRRPSGPPSEAGARQPTRAALSIAALGGWVMLQILATAYARGAGGDRPASRYMDTLGFGMAVNALALGWLLSGAWRARARVTTLRTVAVAWILILVGGMAHIAWLGWKEELPGTTRYLRAAEALTRAYLVTGDARNLESDDRPYPGADSLIERLTQPSLRRLMPVSLRPPLPLAEEMNEGFVENHVSHLELQAQPALVARAGLSPQTLPISSLRSWGSFAAGADAMRPAKWQSRPIPPGPIGGWLKFETAGHIGDRDAGEALVLQLRDAATGARLHDIRPSRVPGHGWRPAFVPAPRAPFVIVAQDADPRRWLAFSEPVEMSSWSYIAWRACKHGWLVAWIAAGVTVAAGIALAARGRRQCTEKPGVRPPPADLV